MPECLESDGVEENDHMLEASHSTVHSPSEQRKRKADCPMLKALYHPSAYASFWIVIIYWLMQLMTMAQSFQCGRNGYCIIQILH